VNAPTVEVTTVTIPARSGINLTVLAQPTSTPGLFVTPQIGDTHDSRPGLTGYWQVTHGASGYALPIERGVLGLDIHAATRVAEALGDTSIDWTVDHDQLAALLKDKDTLTAAWAAIKRGLYPPVNDPADGQASKPAAPGDYPNTVEQATSRQMAGRCTKTGLGRYADNWLLMNYDPADERARRIYIQNLEALFAEYGMVHLLRAFADADREAADAATRSLWEAFAFPEDMGAWLSEWGREYGIATPTQGDASRGGAVLPAPMSYEQVMAAPLMYHDHGTVGDLRQEMAQHAALHSRRFHEICGQTLEPDAETLTEQDKQRRQDEFNMAHSGAMSGWGLVGVLGWLAKEFPQIAVRVARMVDDIGTNGGNDFCQDVDLEDENADREPAVAQ
jgi:hypothetical protein